MSFYTASGYRKKYKNAKAKQPPSEKATAAILHQHQVTKPKQIIDSFRANPKSFDFKKATTNQLVNLLSYDFDLFAPHVDVNTIPVYEKVRWLNLRPDIAYDHIDIHRLPAYAIDDMVTKKPGLADIIDLPLEKVSTDGWQALINHSDAYKFMFVRKLHGMRNKSELRRLLVKNPALFPIMTIEAIQNSVISAKEWALLLKWPDLKGLKVKYDPAVTEWLDQEILTEILMGNSKTSKQLNTALAILRS